MFVVGLCVFVVGLCVFVVESWALVVCVCLWFGCVALCSQFVCDFVVGWSYVFVVAEWLCV